MKRLLNTIMPLAALMMMLSLASCSGDDQPQEAANSFSYKISHVETSDQPDKESAEMNTIDNAYISAFGISNGQFRLDGDKSACVTTIRTKAEKIEASFNGSEWNGSYKVVITSSDNSTVYSYTYKGTAENMRVQS